MPNGVITADENGLIKFVDVGNCHFETYGQCSRDNKITGLCWDIPDQSFWVSRVNGLCELWEYNDSKLEQISSTNINRATDGIVRCLQDDLGVLCFTSCGEIELLNREENSINRVFNFNLSDQNSKKQQESINKNHNHPYNISDLQCCSDGFAIGGRENEVQLVDIGTGVVVWKAKNVANDKLSLRSPVFNAKLSFLNPDTDSISTGSLILSGTGYKQVRLYDTRMNSSRKPAISLDIGDYRVTSLCCYPNGAGDNSLPGVHCHVGDTAGNVYHWDLNMRRRISTLYGGSSSVRDLQYFRPPVQEDVGASHYHTHLAAVGLDRHLRIYNTTKHKCIKSIYMKSRLTKMLLFSERCQSITCAPLSYSGNPNDDSESHSDSDIDDDNFEDTVDECGRNSKSDRVRAYVDSEEEGEDAEQGSEGVGSESEEESEDAEQGSEGVGSESEEESEDAEQGSEGIGSESEGELDSDEESETESEEEEVVPKKKSRRGV